MCAHSSISLGPAMTVVCSVRRPSARCSGAVGGWGAPEPGRRRRVHHGAHSGETSAVVHGSRFTVVWCGRKLGFGRTFAKSARVINTRPGSPVHGSPSSILARYRKTGWVGKALRLSTLSPLTVHQHSARFCFSLWSHFSQFLLFHSFFLNHKRERGTVNREPRPPGGVEGGDQPGPPVHWFTVHRSQFTVHGSPVHRFTGSRFTHVSD